MLIEMPEVLDHPQDSRSATESSADEAADILDQPVVEELPPADPYDPDLAKALGADDAPDPDEPPKKERTRRKKDKASTSPSMDVVTETRDQPNAVDAALKKPNPPMTPGTRQFQIAQTEAEYVEVCLRANCIEEAIESAKKELKDLNERRADIARDLMRLRNDDQWQPLLFPAKSEPAGTEGVSSPSSVKLDDAPPAAAHSPVDPDAWKSVSIDALNLPGKMAERLKEANAETIGRLESLRAEISQARATWPKGIGSARVTQMESAVVEWLTKNRDSAAFAQAQAQSAANGQPTASTPATADASKPLNFDQWEALSEEQQQEYICARAVLIDDGKENCLATKHPSGDQYWNSGYEAFGRDMKVSECPMVAGPEQDDWIRGWLAHGAVEKYEPDAKPANKPAKNKSAKAKATPALTSLDDL